MNAANKLAANKGAFRSELCRIQEKTPLKPIRWKAEWSCMFFSIGNGNGLPIDNMDNTRLLDSLFDRQKKDNQDSMLKRVIEESAAENSDDEMESIGVEENETVDDSRTEEITGADDDSNEEPSSKKRRVTKQYHLLSFCPTRWYSAWLVMCRFYSLWDALQELKEECLQTNSLRSSDARAFVNAMNEIDKEKLFRVISFLKPLVEGIDYCQSDSTLHIDVCSMLDAISSFYEEHRSMIALLV